MVDNGWMTNARSTRELTGMKFSKVVKMLKRENELKAEALRPMLELQQEFSTEEVNGMSAIFERLDDLEEVLPHE